MEICCGNGIRLIFEWQNFRWRRNIYLEGWRIDGTVAINLSNIKSPLTYM